MISPSSNFAFLSAHDPQLVRLGMLAERYFPEDPNTCLLKLRQFGELLAQMTATHIGEFTTVEESQYDLIRRLQFSGIVPREIGQIFGDVRRAGNEASHERAGDHRAALNALRLSWQLGVWYHRTFADKSFKSGPFIPPRGPPDESAELRQQLRTLQDQLKDYQVRHATAVADLSAAEDRLRGALQDQAFWEQMAEEAEQGRVALASHLAQAQAASASQTAVQRDALLTAANTAAMEVELDEAQTRGLIDEQLRSVGWEVDSARLTYSRGVRPERGRNLAIAEWPTPTGPADYLLFMGLTPVAAVEAKRKNIDVSGSLQQAQRYARSFDEASAPSAYGAPWGDFRLPFVFSSNGRPYLQQLATRSGIWFRDLRRPTNLARVLVGWPTPEGLLTLLKMDLDQAEGRLATEGFEYGFPLRPYQRAAIEAVEQSIREGRRTMLLAMATGTGKTKTCVALIYRLLKAQRFNRVLFLVDRSALGEQAANAFKDTRLENLNTFSEVFGIKEIDEVVPDSDTKVHIATVQGMVARVLNASEDREVPSIDEYDCIVVDECHRGYLLDRELSHTELEFRGFEDYVSKYRRVIDYFDAVKIGLTATPALHTVQIFGQPAFSYSYREAVIDGFLVDHEPPIQIRTELSNQGIRWAKGEQVQAYDPGADQIELFNAPDEIKFDVDDFNRKVVTEPFNQVVCEFLSGEIDPSLRPKTLIFCANDAHADLVVKLLKEAFAERYGEVDDDAVLKITGAADRPLELIRRYKNERLPNVAVTVDLLTTGIDVPEICNLVFLRRVNSRILFDQMLGRATRLCPEIDKESFRIFDAVRLYEAIGKLTAMQPVVVDPALSFEQLVEEMRRVPDQEHRQLVLDQIIAKLQRKKRHLGDEAVRDLQARVGTDADGLIEQLRAMPLEQVARWFTENPDLGEILDRKRSARSAPVLISTHADELRSTARGFGPAGKPEDYLEEFAAYVKSHSNTIPALIAVLKRPRELTRKELRALRLELDRAGYSERNLAEAWRETTNQDIAAGIVGYIRRAAMGDPLVPFEQRVDQALAKILASKKWSGAQRQWLQVIAEQTKANLVVDQESLDDQAQLFRQQGGGFTRLNKVFDGELLRVLERFNEEIWPPAA